MHTRAGRSGPHSAVADDVGDTSAATAATVAAARRANGVGRGVGPDRSAELATALQAFERRFGRPSAPIGARTWRLWLEATARGDHFGGWGRPQPGLAAQFVVDRIEAWQVEREPGERRPANPSAERPDQTGRGRPPAPASLAYFVKLLDDASRHWRHAYRHHHGMCKGAAGDHTQPCRYWGNQRAPFMRRSAAEKWKRYDREHAAAHSEHVTRDGLTREQLRAAIAESIRTAGLD